MEEMEEVEAIETNNWETLDLELKKLREKYCGPGSRLLFRGQSNSEWKLTTSLERQGREGVKVSEYYRLITDMRPEIETFTGTSWDLPDYFKMEESLHSDERFDSFLSGAVYQYMVYLRHHGFPSPLLDWSRSPYVAAFFAFRDFSEVAKRSVYVYCEAPGGVKSYWLQGKPHIHYPKLKVRCHRRHLRQQSAYTICGLFDKTWRFHPHGQVFNPRQDVLRKFNIPSTERIKVLRLLNDYNLNAFSLFDSEESLMETMWLQSQY
jgi:hypothetical protein